jgi:hypothetical protein
MDLLDEFDEKNSACKPLKGIYIFMHMHTYIHTYIHILFLFVLFLETRSAHLGSP